jgi:hypothetical protein
VDQNCGKNLVGRSFPFFFYASVLWPNQKKKQCHQRSLHSRNDFLGQTKFHIPTCQTSGLYDLE